ncbi:MAG: hypothetical protein KDI59_08975, partial [Xanthomonadales bacterium]|nr:hypothetical protein [Xanthomonadales bacterium]
MKLFTLISTFLFFLSSSMNSADSNQHPPQANAHYDQYAQMGETVKLNASNSTDRDGDSLFYKWTVIDKPLESQAVIVDDEKVSSFLTLDSPGTYTIELIVSDGKHSLSTDTIVVSSVETEPQISKIHNRKILVGETAELTVDDAFDPDGDNIELNWMLEKKPQKSKAIIQNQNSEKPVITTDIHGTYTIKLEVSDSKHITDSNIFHLYAVEFFDQSNKALGCVPDRIFYDGFDEIFSNSAPIADVGSDIVGVIGETVGLDGSLSYDIDLDELTYSWSLLTAPQGSSAMINNGNQMIASLTPDLIGDYVAQLIVNDGCLDSDPDSALVTISVNQPPVINSVALTDAIESHNYAYQISATDSENHEINYSLTTAPSGMQIDESGLITWVALSPANYNVAVAVTDQFGASTNQDFVINVTENHAPKIQSWPIKSGEKDFLYKYQLTVNETDNDPLYYSLTSSPANMSIDNQGLVIWTPDTTGVFPVEIQVDDGYGAMDTQTFDLEIIQLPPNPNDIAPPLSKTEYTPFTESIEFLYLNNPPVQVGMPQNTIEEYRSAVITGKVLDDENNPLRGIKVTINNHPEYGFTYTRDDGVFFMVVNGGGTLTINFSKGGYLDVQRDVKTVWHEISYVNDLIILRLDNKVTRIDLTDMTEPYQVAQGNIVTDIDGIRQATLLFPAGTTATMTMPDNSTQNLTQLDVRATEYTVGENGRQRMPADLPAGSAYTYAVELSVDEALNNNAIRVDFSEDVIFYLDNFIGFPQGVAVPTGWYNQQQAYWVPSDNGIVIKIIDIIDGQAVIDVTADEIDNAATQQWLDDLGIDNNELIKLAQLYEIGESLWRTPITHFTPWDCNWPYIPPDDIESPPDPPPEKEPPEEDDTPEPKEEKPEKDDDSCDESGCIINAHNRTLEESIPVIGTDLSLKYRSETFDIEALQDSKVDIYTIPITGDTVPASLVGIRLEYSVGNSGIKKVFFPADTNISYEIPWLGLDEFGREAQKARVQYTLHHVYPIRYAVNPFEFNRLFARIADRDLIFTDRNRIGLTINTTVWGSTNLYRRNFLNLSLVGSTRNKELSGNPEITLDGVKQEQLKMGGWGLENHHVYDPFDRIIYQGDGFKRKVLPTRSALGEIPPGTLSYGHGGPAIDAPAGSVTAVTIAPGGDIYFAASYSGGLGGRETLIRKITADGTVFTVAGNTTQASCEVIDNQIALEICIPEFSVHSLSSDAAGNIYFNHRGSGANKIRKINRSGLVSTVAGSNNWENYGSSNIPATDAFFSEVNHIDFDKHGNLYIADLDYLNKIDTNGI